MPRRAAPPPSPTMSTRSNRSATSTRSSALPPVTAPPGRTTRAKRITARRDGGDGMYTEEEDGVEELDEGGGKGDSPVSRLGSEPSRPRAHVEVQINRPSDRPVYGSTSVNEANALTSAHRKFLSQSQAPGPENGNSNGSHMNGHTGYARSGTTPIPADMSHTSHASSSRRLGTPALIPAPPMETVTARRSPVPEVQTFATTYQLQQRQNGLLSPPLSAHGHSSSFGSTMNGFGHAANGEQRGSVSLGLSSGGRPQGVGRVIAPVAYHMTVNPDDSAQADTSGMGNQTAETSGYSYSAEEEHVRRVMEQQRRQAEAEAEEAAVNARRTGKGSTSRTHRPRLSEDGGGPVKRGSAAQAQHDKARYRPHDDSQTDGDEDDEGGAGIASGGGHLRRSNRGKRAEAQGGPSNNTAGLRQRSTKVGQDRGGETDEGIGGSEEDDRSQERMREKSRSPFPPVHIQAPTPARAPIMQPAPTKRRRQAPAGRAAFTNLLGGFPALLKQIYNLLLDVAYMFASIFRKNRDERIINTSQSSRTDRSGVPGWMKWLAGAAISYAAWQYLVNGTGKQAPHGNGKGGYVAPHVPPGTLEELVERLTGIESAVSAIGSANAVLKDGQRGADDRLRRLETTVPDVERRMIAQSARLDRAELEHSKAWKAANSITDKLTEKLGAMERDLHGLPEGVRALVEKQGKSESALEALQVRLDGVEKELKDVMADGRIGEALQRVLPTYVPFKYGRAGMEIDPTFWVELRKVLVGKDKLGEVVRRTLRQEVDAGYIFAGAGSGKDAKKDAKELDRIREMEREATKAREADWDRLEQWKANLLDKLSDQEGRSPSIRKEHFASLFEENALGLRSAIDDLRALVTSTSSDRSSSKSSATGQSVTYQLSTSEDITTSLTSLIDAALLRYSKDTLARPDYALYSAGARVVAQITTPTLVLHRPGVISRTLWGKREIEALSPAHALMPGNVPGQCWSFKGQEGQLGVMLKERVVVGDLSMEHAPRETVGDVRAAPREVEVWGLVEDQEDLEKVEAYYQRNPLPEDATMPPSPDYLLLSTFTYDVDAPNYIQTFPVPRAITDMGIKMGVVIWKFKSNWGAEDYTCLYRVRVHEALSEA